MHLTLQPGSRPQEAGDKFIEDLAVFREFRSLGTPGAPGAPAPWSLDQYWDLGFLPGVWEFAKIEVLEPAFI